MRFPLLIWALFAAMRQSMGLAITMNKPSVDFVYAVHLTMRLSSIAFLLLIAVVVIARTPPSAKASGLEPRIAALAGSFLTYVMVLFPRCELSLSLEMISTGLIFIGTMGAVVALSRLGRSFSVMAESRRLVTSGPYRFVRHPLYLTEGIAIIGLFIQYISLWAALILALQIAFQLRRMNNEEAVLTAQFPEYGTYSSTTARLIPGIY
jgi:protein-S-isoprenylcysteine O-methyltransferase Ste14